MTPEQHDLDDYINKLKQERKWIEIADDFAYTNGKIKAIDKKIREAEMRKFK